MEAGPPSPTEASTFSNMHSSESHQLRSARAGCALEPMLARLLFSGSGHCRTCLARRLQQDGLAQSCKLFIYPKQMCLRFWAPLSCTVRSCNNSAFPATQDHGVRSSSSVPLYRRFHSTSPALHAAMRFRRLHATSSNVHARKKQNMTRDLRQVKCANIEQGRQSPFAFQGR